MTSENRFFSISQVSLAESILDRIIPAADKMPSASVIALGFIDQKIGESPALSRLFSEGIATIKVTACQMHSTDFLELSDAQKDEVLQAVEAIKPKFFGELVRQVYNGYYTDPTVLDLLGLQTEPPQPGGHRLDEGNFSLAQRVVTRGVSYRQV